MSRLKGADLGISLPATMMNFRGVWNASPAPAYAVDDVVMRNGLAYAAQVVPGATDPATNSTAPVAAFVGASAGAFGTGVGEAGNFAQKVTPTSAITVRSVTINFGAAPGAATFTVGLASAVGASVTWLQSTTLVTTGGTGTGAIEVVLPALVALTSGVTYYLVIQCATPAAIEALSYQTYTGLTSSGLAAPSSANSDLLYGASFGSTTTSLRVAPLALNGLATWQPLGSLAETVNTVAASGAAVTLPDVTAATMHRVTLTAATPAITLPAPGAGKSFTVSLVQDATGGRAPTWVTPSGAIKWAGGAAPTITATANAIDVVSFACIDGVNWLGFVAGQAFA